MKLRVIMLCLALMALGISCKKGFPGTAKEEELLDGPIEGLTAEQRAQFLAGDRAFNDEVFTAETGLGPYFVSTSCGSCHAGDGKGHPFTTLTRFGQNDTTGNPYMNNGGPQLQNRAIPGHTPEELPAGAHFSKFTPPANTGLGFLAALTDAQILTHADPNDADGDGISGMPNYIRPTDYFQQQYIHTIVNGKCIGRFGKKAGAIDLLQQTVNAYNQDMGITSEYAMKEPSIYNSTTQSPDNVPDPEIPQSTVQNVVFYLRTLKAPIQRNTTDADVIAGKTLFIQTGCAKCHTPEWTTPQTDIVALSYKTFYPYTDLLMHDMGPALDDGYTEGSAMTYEWKTPALWGLGLSKNSQGGSYYLMHDGRAHTINDAVIMHCGEAAQVIAKYKSLNDGERDQLIKFLESL